MAVVTVKERETGRWYRLPNKEDYESVWKAQKQLANKAYLMYQSRGRGHVVAFAEDPNFRAFMDGLNLLFFNAVFFGPAQ